MSEEKKEELSFWERAQEPFKVVVLDSETLQQRRSFKLSMMNIYTLGFISFLLLSALISSIFFFTPARKLVPGFGDIEENSEYLQLKSEMDTLTEIVNNQQVYINSMRTLLAGEESGDITMPDIKPSQINLPTPIETKLTDASVAETKRSLKLDQLAFTPPVRGSVSAKYDPATDHNGIDIVAAKDTPILAAMAGIVVSADWTLETGNSIIIQHPNDIITAYKHNSSLLKKIGDRVAAGEAIAIIGNTGELTSGPHLHFELWYGGQHVDPAQFVRF